MEVEEGPGDAAPATADAPEGTPIARPLTEEGAAGREVEATEWRARVTAILYQPEARIGNLNMAWEVVQQYGSFYTEAGELLDVHDKELRRDRLSNYLCGLGRYWSRWRLDHEPVLDNPVNNDDIIQWCENQWLRAGFQGDLRESVPLRRRLAIVFATCTAAGARAFRMLARDHGNERNDTMIRQGLGHFVGNMYVPYHNCLAVMRAAFAEESILQIRLLFASVHDQVALFDFALARMRNSHLRTLNPLVQDGDGPFTVTQSLAVVTIGRGGNRHGTPTFNGINQDHIELIAMIDMKSSPGVVELHKARSLSLNLKVGRKFQIALEAHAHDPANATLGITARVRYLGIPTTAGYGDSLALWRTWTENLEGLQRRDLRTPRGHITRNFLLTSVDTMAAHMEMQLDVPALDCDMFMLVDGDFQAYIYSDGYGQVARQGA